MTYIPGTGPQPLFPAAHLVLCPSVCPVSSLETRLTLHPAHPGCDRNTYSLAMMRDKCGASNLAVELLPEQSGSQSLSLSVDQCFASQPRARTSSSTSDIKIIGPYLMFLG